MLSPGSSDPSNLFRLSFTATCYAKFRFVYDSAFDIILAGIYAASLLESKNKKE
jgi:hypothetical protein